MASASNDQKDLAVGVVSSDLRRVGGKLGLSSDSLLRRRTSSDLRRRGGNQGQPLQIVFSKAPHQFGLNVEALQKIFHDPRVADNKVAILSVAGSCRQGKSFLLNFFLKYLQAQGSLQWMDEESALGNGFPWVVGVETVTSGIVMWSEPFIIQDNEGNDVALLLMDTQGAFGCESTIKDSVHVFSLSMMISSIQIYNVMSNIRETDLQHLQFFTEYNKLAMAEGVTNPIQHLVFLVRDWSYPYQYPYGADGGQALIEKRLKTFDSQHPELRELREGLQKCFSKITCFLLPHPGLKATVNEDFIGQMEDIEEDFKTNIFRLVPFLIGKENLIVKEFHGSHLTGKEVLEYFQTYFSIFQTDQLPDPKSVVEMTSEANNLAAAVVAQDHYMKSMNKIFGESKPYVEFKTMEGHHTMVKRESMKIFDLMPKMGGKEFSKSYLKRLEQHLDGNFAEFLLRNKMKATGQLGMTPGVLFVTIVLLYMISGIMNYLWLDFISFIPDAASYCVMGLLATWLLVRYTGRHDDVSNVVDDIAFSIWERIYMPIWSAVAHRTRRISQF